MALFICFTQICIKSKPNFTLNYELSVPAAKPKNNYKFLINLWRYLFVSHTNLHKTAFEFTEVHHGTQFLDHIPIGVSISNTGRRR
jgi:hypothetical protein